jgi:hypothetical protein
LTLWGGVACFVVVSPYFLAENVDAAVTVTFERYVKMLWDFCEPEFPLLFSTVPTKLGNVTYTNGFNQYSAINIRQHVISRVGDVPWFARPGV